MDLSLPSPNASRESLRPPSSDSHGTGAVMSLLAHALLVAGLAFGVSWHTNEPDGVEAELWASTPQLAAPRLEDQPKPDVPVQTAPTPEVEPPKPVVRPPEPVRAAKPPPPQPDLAEQREAEIALERAAKLKREKERQLAEDQRARERREQADKDKKALAEKDKQAKLKAEQEAERKAEQEAERKAQADAKKKAQAADAQREKMRQDQIRRMQAQLGGTGEATSPGTAARSAGPSSSYAGRIRAYIKSQNKGLLTSDIAGNPTADIEVTLAVDGTIRSTRLVKSSGSPVWDDLARRAVERTGTLPLDVDGRIQSPMVISLRPNE